MSDHEDKPWGTAIGGALVVQLATLSGVVAVVVINGYHRLKKIEDTSQLWRLMHNLLVPSFAAGALLATTAFLLAPESIALLSGLHADGDEEGDDDHAGHNHIRRFLEDEAHDDHGDNENEVAWKFGVSLLSGFLLPILLTAVFPYHSHESDAEEGTSTNVSLEQEAMMLAHEVEDAKEVTTEDEESAAKQAPETTKDIVPASVETPRPPINWPLVASISLGDFFHNLSDGFFIGNAFLLCDRSVAWTIVASTVYHELAQEIADYFLLTEACGLRPWAALLVNFGAGFSCVIGVIIILGADVEEEAQGILLAISAGFYLFIAAVECIPRVLGFSRTLKLKLIMIVVFAFGVLPIGLVLLNHGHCDSHGDESHADEEDGHEGHDHRLLWS